MFRRLKKWHDAFYRGPVDLGLTIPRGGKYQSPTITFGYWLYAVACRHFTYGGGAAIVAAALLLPFATMTLQPLPCALAFSLLALFPAGMVTGWFARPQLEVRRRLPQRVRSGAEAVVDYEIRNTGKQPCLDLRVDTLPWPHAFRWAPEPVGITSIAPGETVRVSARFHTGRRGVFRIPALRADSGFPLHLWCWGKTAPEGPENMLVHPAFTPLLSLPLAPGLHFQTGDIGWVSAAGHSHQFVGCREFRDGDSVRRIHWRSWARVGYPVVKEFHDCYQLQALLVLDTFRHEPAAKRLLGRLLHGKKKRHRKDLVLEASVALTAALGEYLIRERASVHLLTEERETPPIAPGMNLLERVLDHLACLEPTTPDQFQNIASKLDAIDYKPTFTWAVLCNWDDRRREFLELLSLRGLKFKALLVCESPPDNLPSGVLAIRAEDVLSGRCREL